MIKILYYFTNYDNMMFQWQQFHIVDELKTHGCYIDILSPLDYVNIEAANLGIKARVDKEKYELFMTCLNEEYLQKETLSYIKSKGIPTLLFNPDNLTIPFNHKKDAPLFDLVWLTSSETEYLFKRWNCKTVFLPYAANPYFLKPDDSKPEINRIGFIGTPHGSRVARLNTLIEAGLPITIHTRTANSGTTGTKASTKEYLKKFGNYAKYPIGWKLGYAAVLEKLKKPTLHKDYENVLFEDPVPWEEFAAYNSCYSMMLSFTDARSTGVLKHPVKVINLRNFEIPMSGGLQLTLYSEELASYFANDKEIIMGKTMEECVDKARFYMRDENAELRHQMKQAARKRAESEHTWYNRFSKIFEILGIHG